MNPNYLSQSTSQGQALRVALQTLTCCLASAVVSHEIKEILFVGQQTRNPNLKTGAKILGLTR